MYVPWSPCRLSHVNQTNIDFVRRGNTSVCLMSALAPYVPLLPCRLSHGIKTCLLCGYLGRRVGFLTAIKLILTLSDERTQVFVYQAGFTLSRFYTPF